MLICALREDASESPAGKETAWPNDPLVGAKMTSDERMDEVEGKLLCLMPG
jgi:hypothetical protein